MRSWLVGLCLLALCLGVRPAAAQPGPSPVSGRVTDSSGAPIAGAIVTFVVNGAMIGSPAITDQRGSYQVSVPAGECTLTVNADGFRELSPRVRDHTRRRLRSDDRGRS
jgi:Carboxypeptidase regulatory-like domain